ncbi:MAG: hypothetical protein ABEK10_00520 [Candidatus Nanosalina sp.]
MAGQKLDNLEIAEVASLTNEQVEDFKEKVQEKEPTVNDLEKLIEAEEAGKDREEVIQYLNGMIKKENVSDKLETASGGLEDLEETIDEIDELEDTEDLDDKEEVELDQSQIIELVEGTVKELKEYVNENFLYRRQLQEILDAEKAGKNRKTAKRFLEKKIENKGIEEEIKESRRDLERLKEDVENLREHFEDYSQDFDFSDDGRSEEDQKAAEELLEITNSIIEDLKDADRIVNKPELEEKTNEVILALQNDDYGKVRDKLIEINEMGREDSEEETKEEKEKLEKQDKKIKRMKEIVSDIESSESQAEEEEKTDPELEKKKEIADKLNTDYSESDLEQISLDELEELKREQDHREDLIDKLKEKGLDESDLRQSTTSDLEKLLNSSNSMNQNTSKFEEVERSDQKSSEELKEEAEEDLERLQGAVSQTELEENSFEETDGGSAADKIEKFKQEIKNHFEGSSEANTSGMREDEVKDILEKYRGMDKSESSVKVAHVMKSYLESKLNVNREMTYRELADRIPENQNDEMRELSEFFEKMHKQEYTDSIQIENMDEVIDNCEAVLKEMA